MKKILIAYGTRYGATKKSAEVLYDELKDSFSVDVFNVKENQKAESLINDYDCIIIGSSIACHRWTKETLSFLKQISSLNKKIAIFVSAGDALNRPPREVSRAGAIKSFIDPIINKYNILPIAKTVLGGFLMVFGKERNNSWNKEEVVAWAAELKKILK